MAGSGENDGAQGMPGALGRVLPQVGGAETLERLSGLSGSDFTSLMMEVARRRAARETPASVLRRYRQDRFTRPGTTPWRSLRRAEDVLLGCLPDGFEMVTLAPLVPLGTHSALATVSQHKVVTAIRACEVAADPTNALAIEAAARRGTAANETAADETVELAAVQRVVRAQPAHGAGFFAHFSLLGLVTAGRDQGSCRFEITALARHLRFAISGLTAAGLPRPVVALTPLSPAGARIAAGVREDLASSRAQITEDPSRQEGRGYYRDLCFKVHALAGGEPQEIGDGGFTDWTIRLRQSSKERLLISGLGIDRIAAFMSLPASRAGEPGRE